MKITFSGFVALILCIAGSESKTTGLSEGKVVHSIMKEFQGTEWEGPAELWTDTKGNEAFLSEATLKFETGEIAYTWAHEGETHTGRFRIQDEVIEWRDSWHQPEWVPCKPTRNPRGLLSIEYGYEVGSGADWFWRILFSQRPDGNLVLQMTNIAPWGEESRAVRLEFNGLKTSDQIRTFMNGL